MTESKRSGGGWGKIRVFACLSNDDRNAEVDVTATVYLHWMVKKMPSHLPLHLPRISLSQIHPNAPSPKSPLLNQNLPVSSLPQRLPNVLKTG